MVSLLAGHGARAEVVPTISVEPPRSPQQMDKAVHGLVTGRYLWVGFTSVNAVRAVRERLAAFGLDARAFSGLRVAAVGGVTANALRQWGIEPDLVPDAESEQSAAGLLESWPTYDRLLDPIDRVFLPRADIATETLVAGLIDRGWQVDDVTAYRTVRAAPPPPEVREAIKGGAFDAVLFTSSSTVRNLVGIAGKPHPNTVVACIGPATAKTAREHGLRVDVLAAEPSVAAVVDALAEYGNGLRASAAEAGEPVVRPSRRRTTTRRTCQVSHRQRHAASTGCGPGLPGRPAAPAAHHPRDAPDGGPDPAAPGRPGAADVRPRGHRRSAADRRDARCRPAHPGLAAQGRGRRRQRPASAA